MGVVPLDARLGGYGGCVRVDMEGGMMDSSNLRPVIFVVEEWPDGECFMGVGSTFPYALQDMQEQVEASRRGGER